MSLISHTILQRVEENINDPHATLQILQTFRLESIVLVVKVAVVKPKLAAELLKFVELVENFVERQLVLLMEGSDIQTPYFTLQVDESHIEEYEEVAKKLLVDMQAKFAKFPNYDEHNLKLKYCEALRASLTEDVNHAEERLVLQGCLQPSHMTFCGCDSLVVTVCKKKMCDGHFTLPNIPTLRHTSNGTHVSRRNDEEWLATETNRIEKPAPVRRYTPAKSKKARFVASPSTSGDDMNWDDEC